MGMSGAGELKHNGNIGQYQNNIAVPNQVTETVRTTFQNNQNRQLVQ